MLPLRESQGRAADIVVGHAGNQQKVEDVELVQGTVSVEDRREIGFAEGGCDPRGSGADERLITRLLKCVGTGRGNRNEGRYFLGGNADTCLNVVWIPRREIDAPISFDGRPIGNRDIRLAGVDVVDGHSQWD